MFGNVVVGGGGGILKFSLLYKVQIKALSKKGIMSINQIYQYKLYLVKICPTVLSCGWKEYDTDQYNGLCMGVVYLDVAQMSNIFKNALLKI